MPSCVTDCSFVEEVKFADETDIMGIEKKQLLVLSSLSCCLILAQKLMTGDTVQCTYIPNNQHQKMYPEISIVCYTSL